MHSGLKSIHFNIRESIFLNPFQFISIHSRLLGSPVVSTTALRICFVLVTMRKYKMLKLLFFTGIKKKHLCIYLKITINKIKFVSLIKRYMVLNKLCFLKINIFLIFFFKFFNFKQLKSELYIFVKENKLTRDIC